ncbi:MAG: kynureninase [Bacteroidota bacterium]|nr:kynureninase [Bacteroidota bacterium]
MSQTIKDNSNEFAIELDNQDELKDYRSKFHLPQHQGNDVIYLVGNSLGLQPKSAVDFVAKELESWKLNGVEGHFIGENPWYSYHEWFKNPVARLVGAKPHEVVVMNNLTVNLHLMMISFYKPKGFRKKILVEKGAFPSDYYAVESQIKLHGGNPDIDMIELETDKNNIVTTAEIQRQIEDIGDELALILLGGVNYYTGQAFNMKAITQTGHKVGANVGFDLAHAAGNIMLELHDWNVDFAVWCTYKYLNSGPGGTSGAFIHEQHASNPNLNRLAGWWGHDSDTRFQMKKGFNPSYGADGWQLSNAQILPMAVHRASIEIFDEVGMDKLRSKSIRLTNYMSDILMDKVNQNELNCKIITPPESEDRGAQLSLSFDGIGKELFNRINLRGIVADWREPNVIRVAAVPLYNSFIDVWNFVDIITEEYTIIRS